MWIATKASDYWFVARGLIFVGVGISAMSYMCRVCDQSNINWYLIECKSFSHHPHVQTTLWLYLTSGIHTDSFLRRVFATSSQLNYRLKKFAGTAWKLKRKSEFSNLGGFPLTFCDGLNTAWGAFSLRTIVLSTAFMRSNSEHTNTIKWLPVGRKWDSVREAAICIDGMLLYQERQWAGIHAEEDGFMDHLHSAWNPYEDNAEVTISTRDWWDSMCLITGGGGRAVGRGGGFYRPHLELQKQETSTGDLRYTITDRTLSLEKAKWQSTIKTIRRCTFTWNVPVQ